MAVIFEFIIYIRGGNCYYSPQAPKYIAMQLVSCSRPRHEAYRKNEYMAPLILNLSTRMSCVTKFTLRSQSRYWWFWRRSGVRNHTIQPADGRYTDYATPATFMTYTHSKFHMPACNASLPFDSQNAQSSGLSRCRFSYRRNDTNKNWLPSRHQSLDTTTAALCGYRLGISHGRHTGIFDDTELGTVSRISANLFHN